MPRFYFDLVEDGAAVADRNGLLMPELEEAELEAASAIAQMMADRTSRQTYHHLCVLIRDSERAPISRVSITLKRERVS